MKSNSNLFYALSGCLMFLAALLAVFLWQENRPVDVPARVVRTVSRSETPAAVPAPPVRVLTEVMRAPRRQAKADRASSREPLADGLPAAAGSAAKKAATPPGAIPGQWILRFKDRAAMDAFLSGTGLSGDQMAGVFPDMNAVRVRGVSPEQAGALGANIPGVTDCTPNFHVSIPAPPPEPPAAVVPAGGNTAFGGGALSWLGIKGEHEKWGEGVTVAVLDVGVGRCEGLNESRITRLDLAGGGGATAPEANQHGTAVAAILAGGIPGREGLTPAANILSVKVLDDSGSGDSFTLAKGIMEATDRGARVLNLCLASRGDCPLVRQAVDYAIRKGAVVVAAVGNDGKEGVSYPARYEGVVGVTAVDAAGNHMDFANRGPQVSLAAPGYEVWAAYAEGKALSISGTSAAVPFVSGALAGLLSLEPSLTPPKAVEVLVNCSNDAGLPGKDSDFGSGIIDMGRVLQRDKGGIFDVALADNYVGPCKSSDQQAPLVVSVQNRGTERVAGADLTVRIGDAEKSFSLPGMDAGETVGYTFALPLDAAKGTNTFRVSSSVVIRGAQDVNAANDSKNTAFSITR